MPLTKVDPKLLGAGSVLQVVTTKTTTRTQITSSIYTDSGLAIAFTPSSTTSKIILMADPACNIVSEPSGMACRFFDATTANIIGYPYCCLRVDYSGGAGNVYMYNRASMLHEMPSWGMTTKTVSVQFCSIEAGGAVTFNESYPTTQQSTLIIMEIAG